MVKIKTIRLKFIGVGYNDRYQTKVMIYDMSSKLVFCGNTYNGILEFSACVNAGYRVVAILFNEIIDTYFYVTNDNCNYIFPFNRAIVLENEPRTVNFLLKDQNYEGLPIERGDIILWQR